MATRRMIPKLNALMHSRYGDQLAAGTRIRPWFQLGREVRPSGESEVGDADDDLDLNRDDGQSESQAPGEEELHSSIELVDP